jgi:putative inorganic carbon (hco3(-)) transporter
MGHRHPSDYDPLVPARRRAAEESDAPPPVTRQQSAVGSQPSAKSSQQSAVGRPFGGDGRDDDPRPGGRDRNLPRRDRNDSGDEGRRFFDAAVAEPSARAPIGATGAGATDGATSSAVPDGAAGEADASEAEASEAVASGVIVSGADASEADASVAARARAALARRGHLLSFVGLFLFTAVLYFRPYELFPALSGVTSMAFWIAVPTLAVFFVTQFTREGNLTARPREVNLVLLLVVAALLSIPLAINPREAWDVFNDTFIKAVLMFVVMVNAVRTERRLRALLWLALAASCFLAVSAISDYSAGRFNLRGERLTGAVGGMFGNPNDLALHLVTMIPVAVAFAFTKRNRLAKIAYATCAALLVAAVVVSFSRGGFLGLVGAGGVLAWKLGRRHKLAVGVCVLVVALGFIALAPGDYTARLGTITSVSADLTGSSSQRQAVLIRSILVTARHPLLGVGMGNFHIVSIHELVSHNAFTQVSAEMGLGALVVYVWFLFAPLRRLREIERATFDSRRASRFYYFAVGLQAALVGYMVSSFFASVAYNFYVYYLVGYAVCLRQLYECARAEGGEQPAAAPVTADAADPARPDEPAPHGVETYA